MISKEIFIEVIENMRQQMYLDKKHGESIAEIFGVKSQCSYNDNLLVRSILELLQIYFPKLDGFCRIEFFIDCLEFGRTTENSDEVTAGELYDTLIKDNGFECCGDWDEYGKCKCTNNGN